jgi:oxalate---CoA ligase
MGMTLSEELPPIPSPSSKETNHNSNMTTLTTSLNYGSSSPAIIIPETGLQLSYNDLKHHIQSLQASLAEIGISPQSAVSISLINGLEFAISFLAVGAQGAIAAPLNPSYTQGEVEFYVDDIKAALLIVPRGAVEKDAPAVRAARKFGAGVAEIWWDGKKILLQLKEKGKHLKPGQKVVQANADDIAVRPPLPPHQIAT